MSIFSDLVASADSTLLDLFGDSTKLLTFFFLDGQDPVEVRVIVKNPAMEEDYQPGSPTGAVNLVLFTRFLDGMVKGCRVSFAWVDYDVAGVDVDREGGATLRLRKRAVLRPGN